jgi:UDP-2,3-diacylglucosamine hydrolase
LHSDISTTGAGATTQHPAALAALLSAPSDWRRIDFISDLHLQDGDAATFKVWQNYMQRTTADAVFILGDLFEVWVGDDMLQARAHDDGAGQTEPASGFEARCAEVLNAASSRLPIFFMHGNRDFLLGSAFAKSCGMTLLNDPCVLDFSGQRWLLSHGDALCLQDSDYMRFRAQVRSPQWQQNFLGQPLVQRQALARTMREQSKAHQSSDLANGMMLADLDTPASCECLRTAQASTLIHGHTHRPAQHELAPGLRRIVLSDWDGQASPVRAEVLRLSAPASDQGTRVSVQRLAAQNA